jgi:ribosomal protein S4E
MKSKRKEKSRNEESKEKKLSVSLMDYISFKRKTEKFSLVYYNKGTISALFLEVFGEPL